ncbi:MAG: glycosyltransferase family 2 protein [Ketobacteraceae bacterium]|nr:glycosyltransferase family 2 protein [Ketobacteraceae bacterium]
MVTIIIVSYNSAAVMRRCQHELLSSGRFRVIVVDNASADGSAEQLKADYPAIEVIALDRNIGYGRGANVGLREVTTPYGFLVNPDLFVTPDDIDRLLQAAREHAGEATVFAPAVKEKDHLCQGLLSREWVIGAAMLFDMALLEKVGLFDENIFLFYEEKDLCFRIRAQGGNILLVSDLYLEHLKGQACKPSDFVVHLKNWHVGWSSFYYLSKHDLQHGKHHPANILLRYSIKAFLSRDSDKRKRFRARLQGIRAFLRGEPAFLENGQPQAAGAD